MSGAREFLEQLQQGIEQEFPEQRINLPLATRDAIVQALLAAIPLPAPVGLPLMVSEHEFWFLFPPHAHHVTVAVDPAAGGRTIGVVHDAYALTSLDTTSVRTRFQTAGRGTELVSATLTFAFATSEPFEVSADYQGEDRTRLSPRAILAFAQALLMLAATK